VARDLFEAAAAGVTVLAPNAELAAALSAVVERMHLDAGHEVWPTPHIRDFGGWLRERYQSRQLEDATLPRLLSEVEERELWRSVILETDAGEHFLEPAGAAQAARRASRAMLEYDIPLTALGGDESEEVVMLLAWRRRFEARCAQLRCLGADQLLATLPAMAPDIAWIESPIWRPVARDWLAARSDRMLLPARATLKPSAGPFALGAFQYRAASPAAELAAMAEWIDARRNVDPQFSAWICIPDLDARRALIHDALDAALLPQRFSLSAPQAVAPYAIVGGTPLAGLAPVRAALDTLSATAGIISFAAFSALLRAPELQESAGDESAAILLDVKLRDRGPDAASLEDWLRIAKELEDRAGYSEVLAVRRLASVMHIVKEIRGRHSMSRWITSWVEIFETGPWAGRAHWSSAQFQAAERFRELLASLALGDDFFGACSAIEASAILRRAAADTAFQPQTGIPPIWVSGQAMDPWLTYDGLWIAGCSEERWPPPPDPIPLLPIRVQRAYKVPAASVEGQLRTAEDLQRRWQSRAVTSVFSRADAADGRVALASPLVPMASLSDLQEPKIQPHWWAGAEEAPQFEQFVDEIAPPFAATELTRGVSTLRAQSLCAFRGFAQTRLRVEPLLRPVPGFNRRERGDMLHDALEAIWNALRTHAQLIASTFAALDALIAAGVEGAIAKQCLRRDPGAQWRRREAPRLRGLLHKWLETEKAREPFEVERLEQEAQNTRHGGLDYRVRLDRVDRLSDGGRVLIDYKSGAAHADWRGDRPDNPQLPLYALLRPQALVAVAYGAVNASGCSFISESERKGVFKPGRGPTSLEGMPDFAALTALWSGRIEAIASEFARGQAQVAPTLSACASCSLQPLCRIPAALDESRETE
jgi:ATP-dependent helicase/nuclease subunit B